VKVSLHVSEILSSSLNGAAAFVARLR
jgi:hypothetical protein